MFYLADTHSLVWFLSEDPQLSSKAKEVFEQTEKGESIIIVPVLVLAEVMFLCERKRMPRLFLTLVDKLQSGLNYFIYELDLEVVLASKELTALPDIHDRLIVATAQIAQAPIITRDILIKKSGYVSVVW
jgi:PIN domain nuclease of toxin-antitoxin system